MSTTLVTVRGYRQEFESSVLGEGPANLKRGTGRNHGSPAPSDSSRFKARAACAPRVFQRMASCHIPCTSWNQCIASANARTSSSLSDTASHARRICGSSAAMVANPPGSVRLKPDSRRHATLSHDSSLQLLLLGRSTAKEQQRHPSPEVKLKGNQHFSICSLRSSRFRRSYTMGKKWHRRASELAVSLFQRRSLLRMQVQADLHQDCAILCEFWKLQCLI